MCILNQFIRFYLIFVHVKHISEIVNFIEKKSKISSQNFIEFSRIVAIGFTTFRSVLRSILILEYLYILKKNSENSENFMGCLYMFQIYKSRIWTMLLIELLFR